MLAHLRIGAADEQSPGRETRSRAPHLLPGDHPLVAVAHGAGSQPGEVRAGAGLGEELAAQLLGPEQWPDEPVLLLGRPEHGDRGSDQLRGDTERLVPGRRLVLRLLVEESVLVVDGKAGAPCSAGQVIAP